MTIQFDAWESSLLAQAYAPLENRLRHDAQLLAGRAQSELAYRHCQRMTREHSHTFYVASALLPRAQRKAIRALYAFSRVSDDLVDRPGAGKAARLQEWRQQSLHSRTPSDDPVALAWADTRARYQIPRQYAEQLLDGIATDLSPSRHHTFAQLAQYSYGVASTVGLMSMHIVGYSSDEAIPYAVKLGVALQLTNILRDVAVDYRRGRLYLPQDELARFGCTESDVCREVERAGPGVQAPQVRALLAHQAARARDYFARATALLPATDARRFVAAEIMREIYRELLRRIEAADLDVFSSVIRVPRPAQARIAIRTWWTHSHFSDHRQS